MKEIKQKIRNFVVESFLFGDESGLMDQTSFLEDGIVDSMGVLELVEFIEGEFRITIADEDLVPENLDSIDNIAAYLAAQLTI